MKKFLIGLAIMIGCIGLTMNANATQVISEKPAVILIDTFTTFSLSEFLKETYHLKKGDTLKILSAGKGGDALTCIGMINHIEDLQSRGVIITTEVAGSIACSANAFIWLAGDIRIARRHDMIMFHLAYMPDSWGGRMPIDKMSPMQVMMLNSINTWIRFKLTRVIRNTEVVNNMLDDPDNWYTGLELLKINVATHMIEN